MTNQWYLLISLLRYVLILTEGSNDHYIQETRCREEHHISSEPHGENINEIIHRKLYEKIHDNFGNVSSSKVVWNKKTNFRTTVND